MDDLHLGEGFEVGSLVCDVLAEVAEGVVGDDEIGEPLVAQLDDAQDGIGELRGRGGEQ